MQFYTGGWRWVVGREIKPSRQHRTLSIDAVQYQWLPRRQNAFQKTKKLWTSEISSFPFVDFQLGFAQPIRVIARLASSPLLPSIPIVRLTSRIIQLWMSVHERLFDVFKNGSRDPDESQSWKFRWVGKSKTSTRKKGLAKRGKSTRATAKAPSFLCDPTMARAKCKLANQEHSSPSPRKALPLQAEGGKAQKPFNWNLISVPTVFRFVRAEALGAVASAESSIRRESENCFLAPKLGDDEMKRDREGEKKANVLLLL